MLEKKKETIKKSQNVMKKTVTNIFCCTGIQQTPLILHIRGSPRTPLWGHRNIPTF